MNVENVPCMENVVLLPNCLTAVPSAKTTNEVEPLILVTRITLFALIAVNGGSEGSRGSAPIRQGMP